MNYGGYEAFEFTGLPCFPWLLATFCAHLFWHQHQGLGFLLRVALRKLRAALVLPVRDVGYKHAKLYRFLAIFWNSLFYVLYFVACSSQIKLLRTDI